MEPPNFHHPQDQFSGYFSSLLSLPPPPQPVSSSINSQDHHHHHHHLMLSSNNSSSSYHNYLMDQSSKEEFSWPPSGPPPQPPSLRSLMNLESFDEANELLISKIKDEMPGPFPKLRDMNIYDNNINCNINSNNNYFSSTFSPYYAAAGGSPREQESSCASRSYHHVMPSVNVLTSDHNMCSSSLVSSSLDLNLRAVDHNLNHASIDHHHHGTSASSRNSSMQMMSHHFMGDSPSHSSTNNKMIGRMEAVSVGKKSSKRPVSSFSDQSSSSKNTNNSVDDHKKKRSTSRPSCPPLKVRKEKLGDRIAGLQRLVAPYGKTDTASVLTEAIGYIQFLHDQVQTLSVPYMRSTSNNKPTRAFMLRSSRHQDDYQHQHQQQAQKEDLKSRGLCLVHQSFASYLNVYNLGI